MCSKMETHDSYNDITSHDINFSGGLCRYLVLLCIIWWLEADFGKALRNFLFNLEETKMVKNSGVRHLIGISKYPLLDNIFCSLFENQNQERDL